MWLTMYGGVCQHFGLPYTTPDVTPNCAMALDHAYAAQSTIGWKNFLKFRVAIAWREIIQSHYYCHHSGNWKLT